MTLDIRRIVTGHDGEGRARAIIDAPVDNVVSNRPGASWSVIWQTRGFPVDNDGNADPTRETIGTTLDDGSVFRVIRFDPGVAPRNHRTNSIDYAVVMAGEIDMVLDDETVRLKAGDVLVQRGTIHDWVNNGTEPCIIAFVLISAKPVTAGGRTLDAKG